MDVSHSSSRALLAALLLDIERLRDASTALDHVANAEDLAVEREATHALQRAAAHALVAHEQAVADVEAALCESDERESVESAQNVDANIAVVRAAAVRVFRALDTAFAWRHGARATRFVGARATRFVGDTSSDEMLSFAIQNNDDEALNLGLVLRCAQGRAIPSELLAYALRMQGTEHVIRRLLACATVAASAGHRDFDLYTPLMRAASWGNHGAIQALLECAQVVQSADARGPHGFTALMFAATLQDSRSAELLLACEAVRQTAATASERTTALELALRSGAPETVEALLEIDADGRVASTAERVCRRFCNTTLLKVAVGRGAAYVTALLASSVIAATAGDTSAQGGGYTALMYAACCSSNDDVFAALLACPTVAATAGIVLSSGQTALQCAVREGNYVAVVRLLECERTADTAAWRDASGRTVLHVATHRRYTRIVEALLTSSAVAATAAMVDESGFTPPMIATRSADVNTLAVLLASNRVLDTLDWSTTLDSASLYSSQGPAALGMLRQARDRRAAV
jgi:ankyrin repeat protein